MSKKGFVLLSLVGAIPGGFLTVLLVMMFLNHADKAGGMFLTIAGITLIPSFALVLIPFAIVVFAAKDEKPEVVEEDVEEFEADEDVDEDEGFGDEVPDDFDGDESMESGEYLNAEVSEDDFDAFDESDASEVVDLDDDDDLGELGDSSVDEDASSEDEDIFEEIEDDDELKL